MSTTVTYKGSTLTTVDNQTRTLKTAGKYMEGDVILTDVISGADIPIFDIEFDLSWDITSATCSKSFAECSARYAADYYCPAYCSIKSDNGYGETTESEHSLTCSSVSSSQIVFTAYYEGGSPGFDIIYYSNGTINWVSPSAYNLQLDVTSNGSYYPPNYKGVYTRVNVNVTSSPTIQSLNITPSTSQQTFNDSSVDGYKPVTVSAMSTMTLPTSAAASATSGYTSKATIGRSTSAQYINIPPGYNSTGAYYVISAVANGSATGPTSLSGTSATVSTGTNTLTLTKTGVTTTPTVSAGYVSSATASTATVTLTASVTTKAAATITPTTTNQTIASGTYLTGAQTIAGDADLVGSNIISTANIFGVQGTVVLQTVYTGSSAPSSSTGINGDIYIQS